MIRNYVSCFLPVQENERLRDISILFTDEEKESTKINASNYTPSIPFIEFIAVSSFFGNISSLEGRIFVSSISEAKAEVISAEIINDQLFLELSFFSSLFFYKNEDIVSLMKEGETSSITLRVLERHFKRPENLLVSLEDRNKIDILKNNDRFKLKSIKSSSFNHENNLILVKNLFTKKTEIIFFQESNQTSII